MHPSTAFIPPRPPRTGWPRSVWVVITLMCATIAALGAALVWRGPDSAPQEPALPLALAAGGAAEQPMPATATTGAPPPQDAAAGPKPLPVAGPAPVQRGAPAGRGTPTNDAAASPRTGMQPVAVSVCNSCGVVEAVEPVQRQGKATGVGAVAGGVVGGAIGNRMGAGSGKTALTVLGAIGGGFSGNAIEKHARAETVYRVKVRMEDGSLRMLTRPQSVAVGSHVTVNGETLKVTSPPPAAGSRPA
ncbi:glycine zipper 2TM domain-containing protein [Ideonella sp.]|uniref:glycine zipper 2TM domain-containing protein n=1 Tax=Ideonella sp. TaxID=1929293 RepID=UPI002B47FF7D|nr:glycine zipper 2TM domain-containing protein [Ideonella sp.]HJV70148.1 glycine zipper 2TM domain-containing protein [Ideonella sp.]